MIHVLKTNHSTFNYSTMGVYLSSPVTEKVSADESHKKFRVGASSMQGWRCTQEDAHNCIADFDTDTGTSLFAVYDGHGGAEVAEYSAKHLPDFIKMMPLYREGGLGEAMQEAFLGFDATLKDPDIIKKLTVMAGVDEDEVEDDEGEDGMNRTEADVLRAEADMPMEELMAKYGGPATAPAAKRLQEDQKYMSPQLRGKRPPIGAGDADEDSLNECNSASSSTDPIVARLDERLENGHADGDNNGHPDNDNNLNVEKEMREAESSVKTDTMECDSDTNPFPIQSDKPDSSASSAIENGQSSNVNDIGKMEADSTTDTSLSRVTSKESDSAAAPEPSSSSESQEASVVKPVSPKSDNSAEACSSNSGTSASKTSTSDDKSVEPESSQAGSSTDAQPSGPSSGISESGPSGSGSTSTPSATEEAGGSGVGSSSSATSTSDSDPSGSGVQSGSSGMAGRGSDIASALAGRLDDDDDDSEEDSDQYEDIEDSEEEEDEENMDEDEEMEGGLFSSRVISVNDEQPNEEPGSDSGCTAVVALVRDGEIVVANAGDSRCVMCRDGAAVELSFDHKPEDEPERTRIEAAGGKVTADGRVNGGLNLSRALGDHWYKRNDSLPPKDQMISAHPDVVTETIGVKDEFIILACDGIWNYMTSQEVIDFVSERLKDPEKRNKVSTICEEMFDHCLAPNTAGDGTGCDNMTCVIIVFNHDDTSGESNSAKRSPKQLDTSASDEAQPEKRVKLNDVAETVT